MEIIGIKDFSFKYPGSEKNAVDGMTLSIKPSEFIVICGPSGCGKTTLVRNLKPETSPYGTRVGEVNYRGGAVNEMPPVLSASQIGFVMQDPENQIVTDTVWHELAFGLENLGLPSSVIRRRVAETAHFFGINEWFERKVFSLSGGQKQLLNLASVMVMQPKILILDEPTAQLDPIAAKEFLTVLKRINQEVGTTVIITEHRLEDVLPDSDKVLFMEDGKTVYFGTTSAFVAKLADDVSHPFFDALPGASKIAIGLGERKDIPLTVRQGRLWLKNFLSGSCITPITGMLPVYETSKPLISAKDIWFRYTPKDDFALRGFSLDIPAGLITAVVGGNGSGKTTALSVLSGIFKPARGSIKQLEKNQKRLLLPQNPKTIFVHDTVRAELDDAAGFSGSRAGSALSSICHMFELDHLLDQHPYDLSGGEMQKAAIAKLLLLDPDILFLDEPTKGLDAQAKSMLASILRKCCTSKRAVVLVTHDIEFAAEYSDICAMIFNGEVICHDPAKTFFEGNTFYTTSANRISRSIIDKAVTCKDVISACQPA